MIHFLDFGFSIYSNNPRINLPMSDHSLWSFEGTDRQNIKLIYVTYTPEFRDSVLSAYTKIAEKYATVHLCDEDFSQKLEQ